MLIANSPTLVKSNNVAVKMAGTFLAILLNCILYFFKGNLWNKIEEIGLVG